MIQRIQTIYLLLAGIASGLLLILPIGYQEQTTAKMFISENIPVMIATAIAAVCSFLAIILFNNRPFQMKVTLFSMVLSLLVFTGLALIVFVLKNNILPNYLALFLPAFSAIFNFMAYKGIKADEKLVRSMDRLR